jgi:chromosomal replication initiator protein
VATLAQAISQRIGEARYNLWFANKTSMDWEGGQLNIGVANLLLQDWLEQKFGADVRGAVADAVGPDARVRFIIKAELFQAARQSQANVESPQADQAPAPKADSRRMHQPRRLRTLDEFVVGPCNRVAHASALSLLETPHECPIPLVVHGSVGIGKTHLLEAVCAGLNRRHTDWKVLLLTAEEFTNRFVQAMQHQKLHAFRRTFRDCDALLIDDIHFLAKKKATQEEFLHTLDALHSLHRPVMATIDCHPRLTDHLLPELTDRLVGGAVWGITPPDEPTRLALLRTKAMRLGEVPANVLAFLAENLRGNIRELEGALHSVVHFAKVHGRPVDVEMAREAIGDVLRNSIRHVSLTDVENAICEVLGVSRELLFSKKRNWVCTYPRMLAMYLGRRQTGATYQEVGKHFSRNHSTVVAAEKKVSAWLQTNLTLQLGKRTMPVRDIVERIERVLEG